MLLNVMELNGLEWSRAIVEVGESIVRCADWIEVEQRIERVANS